MATAAATKPYTLLEFQEVPGSEHFELVDGQLVGSEMGAESSWVANLIASLITQFVQKRQLGSVFNAECGYRCFPDRPDTVRRPDVSFVSASRLPPDQLPPGYLQIAPDLAVEVVSPNDLFIEVRAKVEEYLTAGVALVWVIDPQTRALEIWRGDRSVSRLGEADVLTGEGVLRGFRCRVADFLPPRSEMAAGNE